MLRSSRQGLALLLTLIAVTATAVEYEDYFIGFSTELAVSSDLDVEPFFPDSLTVQSLSFAATYGPATLKPIRFRGGLGWFPSQPFRIFTGIEIPVFEHLNRSRARGFGVYLIGDIGVTLPLGWTADASLAVLIPTSALGGIRLGFGMNRNADLHFTFSTATGAYPIQTRR